MLDTDCAGFNVRPTLDGAFACNVVTSTSLTVTCPFAPWDFYAAGIGDVRMKICIGLNSTEPLDDLFSYSLLRLAF
jgi:hypothetical protein